MTRLILSLIAASALLIFGTNDAIAACGKVSECPDATIPLSGTEQIFINQGGVTKKTTIAQFASFGGGTLTCAGVADMAPIINALTAANPRVYPIANGSTCNLGSKLVFRNSHSGLTCDAGGASHHFNNVMDACAVLKWIGPAGGTMVEVGPVQGNIDALTVNGMLFSGIAFQCDGTNTAAIGIQAFDTSGNSEFQNLYFQRCSQDGMLVGGTQVLNDGANFRKVVLRNIECYTDSSVPNMNCITGITPTLNASDVNNVLFENVRGRLVDGSVIELDGSDSNMVFGINGGSIVGDGAAIMLGSGPVRGNFGNWFFGIGSNNSALGKIVVGGTGGTDGVCAGTTYRSVSGAFNRYDIGKAITGTNIPGGTTITAKSSPKQVTLSQACSADGSGLTYAVAGRTASVSNAFYGFPANTLQLPARGTGASFRFDFPTGQVDVATGSTYNIAAVESGTVFTNAGAVTTQAFRLPVIQDGMKYCFINAADGVAINPFARSGTNIQVGGIPTIATGGVSASKAGSEICLETAKVGGALTWIARSVVGDWFGGDLTVAKTGASFTGSIAANAVTGSIATNSGTGSISGTTLTVTAIGAGTVLAPDQTIAGGLIIGGTQIVSQISGTAGNIGDYEVSIPQEVASGAFTASGGGLTVTAITTGGVYVGTTLSGAGITAGNTVQPGGTGTGGTGTYPVSVGDTVGSEAITPSGGTLTVTAVGSGTLTLNDTISGAGVSAGNQINIGGTGTGLTGTYATSIGDTVGSEAMTISASTYALSVAESGKIINTDGTAIDISFSFPVIQLGLNYCFVVSEAHKVLPHGRSGTFTYLNSVKSASAGGFSSSTAGDMACFLVAPVSGALSWVGRSSSGTWTKDP